MLWCGYVLCVGGTDANFRLSHSKSGDSQYYVHTPNASAH